jgi:hypothetical protein
MLTEEEALAQLNEKLAKNEIKETTRKYIEKLKILDSMLTKQKASLEELKGKIKLSESEIDKTRGAISMLIELAAEEEDMLPKVAKKS